MSRPQLWLLAGGNGAGKSTFYRLFLQPRGVAFINADAIAREIAPEAAEAASYEAAIIASRLCRKALASRTSFCFETVFSHPSKIDLLGEARAAGYEVNLVFIYLSDSALHLARVQQRVTEGGHYVPDDKVASRLPRTQANIAAALPLCDTLLVFDNSSADDPFQHVASRSKGRVTGQLAYLPGWLAQVLAP